MHKLGEAARCELVDLLFSLVWVPGKYLTSVLDHWLKCLGTTDVDGEEHFEAFWN